MYFNPCSGVSPRWQQSSPLSTSMFKSDSIRNEWEQVHGRGQGGMWERWGRKSKEEGGGRRGRKGRKEKEHTRKKNKIICKLSAFWLNIDLSHFHGARGCSPPHDSHLCSHLRASNNENHDTFERAWTIFVFTPDIRLKPTLHLLILPIVHLEGSKGVWEPDTA